MIRVVPQVGSPSEAFAALKRDWQRLFAASDCAPFLSWEWASAWIEHFGDDKTPYILKAYRGENLIGILPMYITQETFLGMPFKKLGIIGDGIGGADYLDIIAGRGDESDAAEAAIEFLQTENLCDLAVFEQLSGRSELLGTLNRRNPIDGGRLANHSESQTAACPQVDLSTGWESVLKQSKRANNFKRRLKKLKSCDGFEFRSITAPDEATSAFERFLKLHQNRWESAGGSELCGHPRLIAFQRRVVSGMAAAGLLRFDELWLDGECRSSVYGLDDGTTFYYFNSGYDTEYSQLSVGLVLLGLSIKNAVERGNKVYDFLRGIETYKFDWANDSAPLSTVTLNNDRLRVAMHQQLGRAAAELGSISKIALPDAITRSVGNWRRAWKRNYQLSVR